MSTNSKKQLAEMAEAQAQLREMLKPGDKVRTILRHVSKSGMSRSISVVIDGEDMTYLVARAMNERVDQKHGGIKTGGAGMDMGWHLVYNLTRYLWPDGYPCIGEGTGYGDRCPSSDHVNPGDGRDNYGADVLHRDGYGLRQRWL